MPDGWLNTIVIDLYASIVGEATKVFLAWEPIENVFGRSGPTRDAWSLIFPVVRQFLNDRSGDPWSLLWTRLWVVKVN